TPASIIPGDTLTITVTDADLDTNPAVAETVDVTVTDSVEIETVTLTETLPNSGVFSATLPTQFGTGGTDEDGTLDVQALQTVVASYDDALLANGDTATVSANTAVNAGTSGTIELSPDNINPGDTLTITVTDADLDTNPAVAETVDVTVTDSVEVETVTLTETLPNSGIFIGTLATQFGIGGTDEDGTLDVQANDDIDASYDDALTDSGGTATVTDTTMVTGGVDGTIVMTPASIIPGDTLTITVTDADLDTNPAVAETVDVTVTDSLEIETVTLTETLPNSGIFSATLPTQFGTGGTNEDGTLDVQALQTIVASYDDALLANGDMATVSDNSAVTGGMTGVIDLTPAVLFPGNSLSVTVTDSDLNANPLVAESVSVTVVNTTTNESEILLLIETAPSTGIFSNTLATIAGTGGVNDDGTLEVQVGENVTGTYNDALTASGGPGTTMDTTTVASASADLVLGSSVSDSTPAELQAITYTITLTNNGPDTATNITVNIPQPAGVTFGLGSPDLGTWLPASHDWQIASLPAAGTATLTLPASADSGQLGNTIDVIATVTALDQVDPDVPTSTLVRILVSPPGAFKTWVGGTGGPAARVDWDEPDNWFPSGVPGGNDDVYVPATANPPVLNSDVTISTIEVDSTTLDLNGFDLTVAGELNAKWGTINGPGSVIMNGGQIQGTVPDLEIAGLVDTSGDITTSGNLVISGDFNIKSKSVFVGGDFSTTGTGTLIMQQGGDYLEVFGNTLFAGGDSWAPFSGGPRLDNGDMVIHGDFTQTGHPRSFAADFGHKTIFTGPASQQVSFANPDNSVPAIGSRFAELQLAKGPADGAVELLTDMSVLEDLIVFPGWQPSIMSSNNMLTAGGADIQGGGTFDNTRLQFVDGGKLKQILNVAFDNMARDEVQITISQPSLSSFDFIDFDNIDFRTWPDTAAGGLYVELDHPGAAVPTLQVLNSLPQHGVPWTNTIGTFNLLWVMQPMTPMGMALLTQTNLLRTVIREIRTPMVTD
ncbi:MAG: DUF11 domain-containing protein, partial [Gammaproteobacteria bacterium]|nr:DUF11 domain-containing protein [Gammaproteobacteria bacterium]